MEEKKQGLDEGQKGWLRRKVDAAGDDDGCISVGGLAVECGATFDEKGNITIGGGHPVDLVIDIPRLGLKSGDRATVVSVKSPEMFEIMAWSEPKKEMVSVVVERSWLIAVLPREAAKPE